MPYSFGQIIWEEIKRYKYLFLGQIAVVKRKIYCILILVLSLCFYRCGNKISAKFSEDSIDLRKGDSLLAIDNDSAFYFFNRVTTMSNDSMQVMMAYYNMGVIQSDAGDYYGAQECLLGAMKFLSDTVTTSHYQMSIDNELGNTSSNLKNYGAAISYYDQALKLSDDDESKTIALNNKAVAYQKNRQYKEALHIYNLIVGQSKDKPKRYARILSNMARTKWLQDSSYNAAPELWEALSIREKEKDNWGLNASYAHLSDYYTYNHPDSALAYAEQRYAVARLLSSPDDELEALQKLIKLADFKEVKGYFTRYQFLNDSLQTARNNAKNQFALIRYEATKNKADNLILQKDNAEKKSQIIILFGSLSVVIVLAVLVVIWYRKRKEKALIQQRLSTSKKVHDVVANGIYLVMSEIDYVETLDKETLLDQLDEVYKQSRNISYELKGESSVVFHESIAKMLVSFSSARTKVLIVGNSSEIWNSISSDAKNELKQVLQELMVNMKKHSSAENVVVKFSIDSKQFNVQYTDDGVGLPEDFKYGNGLSNMENRMAGIGAKVIFDRSVKSGLKILIFIPIASSND